MKELEASGEDDLTGTPQKLEDGVRKINWHLVPKAFKCKVKKFRLHPLPTGKHYLFLSWRTSWIKKINQYPTWPPPLKEDPFSIISDLIELWGAQTLGRNSKVIFSFLQRVYCLSKDLDVQDFKRNFKKCSLPLLAHPYSAAWKILRHLKMIQFCFVLFKLQGVEDI